MTAGTVTVRRLVPVEQRQAGWGFLVRWGAVAHTAKGTRGLGVGITRRGAVTAAKQDAKVNEKRRATASTRAW